MSMESRGAVGINISGDTNSLIKEAAARYQVDPRLVAAVAQTESGAIRRLFLLPAQWELCS